MKANTCFILSAVLLSVLLARAQDNGINAKPVTPMIYSSDTSRLLDFFTTKLGFAVDARVPEDGAPQWARVKRGTCFLMIATPPNDADFQDAWRELGNKSKNVSVRLYIGVDDVDKLHAEFKKKDVKFANNTADDPIDRPWGAREFFVRDPDGNVLAFSRASNQ